MRSQVVMDARRYDRNADKLAQIYWHVNKMNTNGHIPAQVKQQTLLAYLEMCLTLNDELGKMAERGLI